MNMHLRFEPIGHTFQLRDPQAIISLRRLVERVHSELDAYRRVAMEGKDRTRVGLAESVGEWLSGEGVTVYSELLRKIRVAGHEDQERMRRSIEAAMRLVDVTKQGCGDDPDARDMVWDWCKEVLPSLRRAFQRFPDHEEAFELEDTRQLAVPTSEGYQVTTEEQDTWHQPAEQRKVEGSGPVAA